MIRRAQTKKSLLSDRPFRLELAGVGYIIITLACAAAAFSQVGGSKSMAVAGAYSARASGVEAIRWNPANLGLTTAPGFSMQFLGIGSRMANSSFGVGDYKKYSGKFLTDQDKTDILDRVPEDGVHFFGGTNANIIGFSVRRFAVSTSVYGASRLYFSKEFLRLALFGNEFGQVYDFSSTGGRAWALGDFGVSYGQPFNLRFFDSFAAGATLHILTGIGYAEVVQAEGVLRSDVTGFSGNGRAELLTAEGGSGIAIDFGLAGKIGERWRLSARLDNLLSNVTWSKKVQRNIYGFAFDSLTVEQANEADEDSLFNDYEQEISGGSFRVTLPKQLVLGAAYFTRAFIYSIEYRQGFENSPITTTTPYAALGVEYRGLRFLPLRAGIGLGGRPGVLLAYGLGLRLGGFSMNFAAQAQHAMLPGFGRGLGMALDFKIGL